MTAFDFTQWLMSFLGSMGISIIAGVISVWLGIVIWVKIKGKDYINRLDKKIDDRIVDKTKDVRGSVEALKYRIEKIERKMSANEEAQKHQAAQIDRMANQIDAIYKAAMKGGDK